MISDVRAAEQRLDELDEDDRPPARVALKIFEVAAARVAGNVAECMNAGRGVLTLLDHPEAGRTPAARHYRILGTANLGVAEVWMGHFPEARHHLEQAASEGGELGLELPRLNAESHLAVTDAIEGRLADAHRRAAEVLTIAQRRGWEKEPQVLAAHVSVALRHYQKDEADLALAALRAGLAAGRGQNDGAARVALNVTLAHVHLARGDLASAGLTCARVRGDVMTSRGGDWLLDWLDAAEIELLLQTDHVDAALHRLAETGNRRSAQAHLLRVRALLAGKLWTAAEEALPRLLDQPGPSLFTHVQAWLLKAALADHRGDDSAVVEALRQALKLARSEGMKRPFRALGPSIFDLVVRHREALNGLDAFVTGHAQRPWTGTSGPPLLIAPLTPRELEVLRYLPARFTYKEIAAAHFVSVNTVKGQLNAIYRKLGATGRTDAVDRARYLELL
jgi:LuxR family transcriptional regulator, maltose regulon positive regulatory protein